MLAMLCSKFLSKQTHFISLNKIIRSYKLTQNKQKSMVKQKSMAQYSISIILESSEAPIVCLCMTSGGPFYKDGSGPFYKDGSFTCYY
jgi:hypothetical protein